MTKTLFVSEVYEYTHKLAQRLQEDFNTKYPNSLNETFEIVEGRKYYKINSNNSVHCFVDKKTGDVYKPASWSRPASIVRYNLLDSASRSECYARADWAGGYLYLR